MWVAEFKVWHAGSVALELSKRFNATGATYYLSAFEQDGEPQINRAVVFYGPDAQDAKEALHKDKRVTVLGEEAGQILYSIPTKQAFHAVVLDRTVFFTKPIFLSQGFEYWTCAALRKQDLVALHERVKRLGNNKATIAMLSIKEKPHYVFLSSILSELTETQRMVLQAAVEAGYYEHPRKIHLVELASRLGMPRSTLQHHLREAERKALPALVEQASPPDKSRG